MPSRRRSCRLLYATQVDVPSTWRDQIVNTNAVATETHPLKCAEVETQTGSKDNQGTQTDDAGGGRPPSPSKVQASGVADFMAK